MSDDDTPKVVTVDFERSEAKALLEQLKRDVPDMVASNREIAKILRAKYLALVETGFTKKEALKLCKKMEW